jgi:hypothetical protein
MSGLYPKLDEPWSDVDEEGTVVEEDDDDNPGSCGQGGPGAVYSRPSNLSDHSRSPRDSTDGVNLSEFQDHFLGRREGASGSHDPPVLQRLHQKWQERNSPASSYGRVAENSYPSSPIFGGNPRNDRHTGASVGGFSGVVNRGWGTVVWAVQWTLGARLWQKAVLTVLLGVLCSMIVGALRPHLDTHKLDNYLPCMPEKLHHSDMPPCMEEPEAKFARVAALKMADILHKRAVQYICGTKDVPSLAMSLEELRQMDEIKDVSKDDMKNVFYLVLVNPHWNIRWMNSSYKTVADWTHYPQSSDRLASSSHSLPFKCRFFLKLAGLWSMLQWIILAILGGVVVYAVFALYQKKKRRQESAVFSMVGRIMDVMKYHYKKSSTKKDLLPYLAIIHVRDMLIPPSERKAKEGLWDEAVQWIACNESRVRVETRRIAGQDFQVWRWIQEDPPPTEIPSSRQPLSPGGQQGRSQGNWHGSVFDHYPPEITTKVAPPTGTPSVCIRLKNMFEPIRKMSENQIHELENAVLERCHPHGAVVHVWVDKKSPVGCVYLKMDSLKSAMECYNVLHGGWYKGQ